MFEGSDPAEDFGFLSAIKIRRPTSFEGEVKPSVPCRQIFRHVKEPYKYERDNCRQNFANISRQVSPALLLSFSTGYCQRTLVGE
jgi:hypothetical protein